MKFKSKKIAVNRIAAVFMVLLLVPSMLGYVRKARASTIKRADILVLSMQVYAINPVLSPANFSDILFTSALGYVRKSKVSSANSAANAILKAISTSKVSSANSAAKSLQKAISTSML